MDTNSRKTALRMVNYGLYVVTAATADDRGAFLCNWLTQTSFEPPLVAVSIEHDAHSLQVIQQSGRFAVNVLEAGQRELAGWFGRHSSKVGDKLAKHDYQTTPAGSPLLPEALSWFECEVRAQLTTGDHVLVVGEVMEAGVLREGTTLQLKETGFKYAG